MYSVMVLRERSTAAPMMATVWDQQMTDRKAPLFLIRPRWVQEPPCGSCISHEIPGQASEGAPLPQEIDVEVGSRSGGEGPEVESTSKLEAEKGSGP